MLRILVLTIALALSVLSFISCSLQPASSAPGVLVTAPPSASVYTVGEQVAVQSTSTDPNNVLRVALVVDGVIVREDSSPVATGQQQFSVIQTWTADKEGQHNLIVRATNAQGVTTDAGIYIVVQAAPAQPAVQPAVAIPTATILPAATLALPPAPQPTLVPTNPAITVIVTATPQNSATPSPTAPVIATLAQPANTLAATESTASKTTASQANANGANTLIAPTVAVATAVPPTVAPPLANGAGCAGQPAALTFTASKTTITAGQSVTLNWGAVNNASIATLNGGAFNALGVAAPGSVNATPAATTTYTLTATCNNGGGTRTASVTVTVNPAAQPTAACTGANILAFAASAETITSGQSVTLNWTVSGSNAVTLAYDNQTENVAASGSKSFTPTQTTTYTLTGICNGPIGNQIGFPITVIVNPGNATCGGVPRKVNSFTASPETITAGGTVTISWNVQGVDKVTLRKGNDAYVPVALTGSLQFTLQETTDFGLNYSCSVGNGGGGSRITVTVTPAVADCNQPAIGAFLAIPGTIKSGETTTLRWTDVTDTDILSMKSDNFGTVAFLITPSGSRDMILLKTTTFQLIAHCDATNKTVTSDVLTVNVTDGGCSGKPVITSFTADKTTLNRGEYAQLHWGPVTNADEVYFTDTRPGQPPTTSIVQAPGHFTIGESTEPGTVTLTEELTARCATSNTTVSQQITLTWNP